MATSTDHRLVRARIKINKPVYPLQKKQGENTKYEREKLKDANVNAKYQELVTQKIECIDENDSPQVKWDKFVKVCHESSIEAAPRGREVRRSESKNIIDLSNKQK